MNKELPKYNLKELQERHWKAFRDMRLAFSYDEETLDLIRMGFFTGFEIAAVNFTKFRGGPYEDIEKCSHSYWLNKND